MQRGGSRGRRDELKYVFNNTPKEIKQEQKEAQQKRLAESKR